MKNLLMMMVLQSLNLVVHPNNSIRAGFGTCRRVAGGNWDSEITQNVLECNLLQTGD
jgi:hypothetical protein